MKQKLWARKAFIFLLLLIFLGNIYAEDKTLSLESVVLDDMDADPTANWIVSASEFTAKGYPQVAKVMAWPEALHGKTKEGMEYYCLGVRAGFDVKAYNYLEIVPAKPSDSSTPEEDIIFNDANGKSWVHKPVTFIGIAKALSVWVWSANYNYYFEAHIEDHNGVVHVLPMGDLDYMGWRNLRVEIPTAISQTSANAAKSKALKLIKFMVWTRPTEKVSEFFLYVDHVKILTDKFVSRYDGDLMEEPDFMNDVWGIKVEE
ncbi:MAG: flagellar filament outer layer protein FlaA [Spirochaetales bacterium]|nr:flagellar filament outer layer protein FlaA [Spirochaetales bacterium]